MVESAAQMKNALKEMYDVKKDPNSKIDDSLLLECYNNLASSFDRRLWGFQRISKVSDTVKLLLPHSLLKTQDFKTRIQYGH